jgi:putative transposase
VILTYRYRLLPTKRQHTALARLCEEQRQLYNAALEERIDCYRKTGKSISYIDQCKSLTACRRALPEMGELPVNLQRWTLKRLDEAYQGFFRRIKTRAAKAGFPRFRGKGWWDSFGFAEFSGIRFADGRLCLAGGPSLKVHLHRALPEPADIRSCVFRRDGRNWHACLQVAVEPAEKRAVATMVGVDLGLKVFAYCSDGVILPNPQIARRAEKELRRRQRALARCKRGSNRRRKARTRVARLHRKIADTRATWLHQQSAKLVNRSDLIAVEDLNIKNMIRHPTLARSIADASWSKFLAMLAYKAERAGSHLIRVDPRNTSQACSGCSELVPKSLAVRTHSCPHCGLVIDRDWNASLNILRAGLARGVDNVSCWAERPPGNANSAPKGVKYVNPRAHLRSKSFSGSRAGLPAGWIT